MIFNLIAASFCLSIILGWIIILSIVIIRKIQKKKIYRWSLVISVIPICIAVLYFLYTSAAELILSKPNKTELAGTYHITEVTIDNFDNRNLKKYHLAFNSDGTYTITKIPEIGLCEKGTYDVNYSNTDN